MDFSVDDNGLWVIYSIPDSNNTHVAKVNYTTNYKSSKKHLIYITLVFTVLGHNLNRGCKQFFRISAVIKYNSSAVSKYTN